MNIKLGNFKDYMLDPDAMIKPVEHYRSMNLLDEPKDVSTAYGWSVEFFDDYQPVWKILHVLHEMTANSMEEEYEHLLTGEWDEQ